MKKGEEYETTESTERFSVFSKRLFFTGNTHGSVSCFIA
jgi:hypothetical protein